ncbi:flagellar L-ring protein FlgH [Ramlibacter tataouinensis]|uniref:Flagellar L-ring protein FlgH n=1 Tax=Ramlibacter tataouinensis TaxID=94132 RepID=A0A127JZF8_9BURK|nr:flagellar L-ring protein FlgH [Ramlibacter tataouinensis]
MPTIGASLYDEATYRPLTSDNKAFRVGDALTVQVFENSSATSSAETGTRRKNNLNAELTHGVRRVAETGIAATGEFDGGGRTQRANRVLITLTVSVKQILPNGDLRVAGEQLLVVNEEQQRVTLEGRVRPQDVSDGNVVLSTRLADARITYLGEGDVSERQQRAWWRKLLDWVGM